MSKDVRYRTIKDQLGAFDVAVIYYIKNRPVAFRRYRPIVEARVSKREFDKQLHITQHAYAESLRFGFLDVVKLEMREL
jgi:hypothetical protein